MFGHFFRIPLLLALFARYCHPFSIREFTRPHSTHLKMTATEIKITPKVPSTAWRWPAEWPFPVDYLETVEPKGDLDGGLSDAGKIKVTEHLSIFLNDGWKVLEISHESNSVLPLYVSSENAVFLALSDAALTERNSRHVVNLSSKDVPSFPLEDAQFDAVVVSSGVETFVNPVDTFREIWRVLKPDGKCFVCFSSNPSKNAEKPVKMWTTFTDEQKIWISGSYYQYSAGAGWTNIEGYDAAGTTGSEGLKFEKTANPADNAFVVQASKFVPPSLAENLESFVDSLFFGAKFMEADDKRFVSLRLCTELQRARDAVEDLSEDAQRALLTNWTLRTQDIYSILKDVKEMVIPKPVKAMLAAFIIDDWSGSTGQKQSLRRGLGLDPPDDFWTSLAGATAQLSPRDKVVLLSDVLPLFRDMDAAEADTSPVVLALPALVTQLLLDIAVVAPQMSAEDAQLLAVELVASDFVKPSVKRSPWGSEQAVLATQLAYRLQRFVRTSKASALQEILDSRKNCLVAPLTP